MAELNLKGESKLFYYTGGIQSVVLNPGKYKLEVWGAQGGTMTGSWTGVGGKGGYACGEIELKQITTLYIYCGGQGVGYNGSSYHAGGWNGGGSCQAGASGGGGATDISLKNASWNSNDHLLSRIIVAGGGGGSNDHVNGGAGGGLTGVNGTVGNASIIGGGATQTAGGTGWINGSFGVGGGSTNSHGDGGAGGGGWYGGGKANGNNAAGGGGSGYVYTQDSEVNYPEGCLLNSDYFLTNTSMQSGVTSGNGYAKITCVDGEQLTDGMSKQFNYTGYAQGITLLPGEYLFECYGASGGGGSGATLHTIGSSGGLGGYTKAVIRIMEEITVYCYVGKAGFYGSGGSAYGGPTGGWNGGGNGGNNGSGSGGGATDFRTSSGNWNDSSSLQSRFIVAGGGGGADNAGDNPGGGDDGSGGSGGGLSAQGAWVNGGYNSGYAGTQTSGNAFGAGASVSTNTDTGGAGGGWYGGKVSNHNNGGGGGGSSYIKGYPGCNTAYHNKQLNVEYVRDGVLDIGKRNGDGYAKITCIVGGRKITAIKNQGISEIMNHANNGYFYAQPGTIPELSMVLSPGYDFKDWTGDFYEDDEILRFIMPDNDVTIIANATPRNDTVFTVNHYLANVDNETFVLENTIQSQGVTDTIIPVQPNEYLGYFIPDIQEININGDGSSIVDYYYLRKSFILTVLNGISNKEEYIYGETGNISYTKMDNATEAFSHWDSNEDIYIENPISKYTIFIMPPYDCTIFVSGQLNRLNTNIYKNIFPEDVFNLERIEQLRETTPTTLYDIAQEKHGFVVGNVLCYIDGKYQKALACNGPENTPIGMVTNVISDSVFTLMSTGIYNWKQYNYEDTTILYLSDTIPGTLVHYDQIKSRIFVPVAVYIGNGQILMNIQDITIGAPMASYEKYSQNFDTYEKYELDEVIQHAISGVMSDEG